MKTIVIKDLKKNYGKVAAVNGVSLEIERGEVFGFLGPNGAGKTTTIRCLLDFIRPTSGSITIMGKDSVSQSVDVKREVGYLSGDVRLYGNWTGADHINLVKKLRGCATDASKLIDRLNFNVKVRAKNLSSGNKQKLGLILALAHRPKVIILDEPTVGLDPLLQNTVYDLLLEAKKEGATIFMSSHYLHEVELACDRVGIIKNGAMVEIDTINNIKNKRLYKVKASFNQPVEVDLGETVTVTKTGENMIEAHVRGDINPLVKKLGHYDLKDLEIERASLEDIFMEFYRKD